MIPPKAILNTTVVFIVLFLITSIHGYRLIYRFKLIDLFKAENQGQGEAKICVFYSIVSVLLIGVGYLIYTKGFSIFNFFVIFITLALTVIGTFMLFSSLTPLIIKLSKRNKGRYYKGINMIGTSQLLYMIKSSSKTLAIIAILSATTLTAMEVSAGFYYNLSTSLHKNNGFTYAYASNDKEIKASIRKQIFMVFALPLVIVIMHSLVASTLLSRIIRINLTLPILITVSAYTVIYMLYYFLTVSAYYNIINSNSRSSY